MAEGYLRARYGDRYEAYSAGLRRSSLSPEAVAVMSEIGIDISGQRSKSLDEFTGRRMDLAIMMCAGGAGACPVFPWAERAIHVVFPDPSMYSGGPEGRREHYRRIRDEIVRWIDRHLGDTERVSQGMS